MKAPLIWCGVCLIWGTTWLFIKLGLEDLPPVSFAAMRSALGVLALAALLTARRKPLPRSRRDWTLMAGTGVLVFAVNYGLLFWGAQFISSGLTAVLQASIPAFGLVIANFHIPEEPITAARLAAVGLGILGVAVIFSDQLQVAGWDAVAGCGAVVGGALAVAYANVLIKKHGGHLDPAALTAGQMLAGVVPLGLLGLSTEGSPFAFHWTARAVVALVYLALIGSVAGFWMYYWLVRHLDVTTAMLTALVTPLLAVVLGALVLDEPLLWRTLAGGVLILGSVGMVVRRARPAPPSPAEQAGPAGTHP